MLLQRVISAVVLAPLLLLAVWAGPPWYVAAVVAAALVANWELYALLRDAGHSPIWPAGVALTVGFLLDPYLLPGRVAPVVLAACLMLSLVYLVLRERVGSSLVDWAVTWVPPLYVGFLAAFAVALRLLPSGERWVFLVLGITWATDVAAYSVGSLLGRHRFFAGISPRKTVEGAVGGLLAGTLVGSLLAWFFGWDLVRLVPLALLAAVAAEIGDLAESLLKRGLRAKDAGHLIPGHGGVLDRMDSLIFVSLVAYFWAILVGGAR